jgi:hypothetical protein
MQLSTAAWVVVNYPLESASRIPVLGLVQFSRSTEAHAVDCSTGGLSKLSSAPGDAVSPASPVDVLGLPRKEVIQPQLPLRLPCYDFTPITSPTFDGSLQKVRPPASGVACFRGVTGGVYKARERIHRGIADPRLLATPPSWRRISASNPNRDALYGIRSTSRYCSPLYAPM